MSDTDTVTDVEFIDCYRYVKLEMLSMDDKFKLLNALTGKIAYVSYEPCKVRDTSFLSEEVEDLLWMWVDGLYGKWFDQLMEGRCSLRELTEFNIAKEDEKLDVWIKQFYKIYDSLPSE